jgi:hypothetical protein
MAWFEESMHYWMMKPQFPLHFRREMKKAEMGYAKNERRGGEFSQKERERERRECDG